ncbi:MAG: DnaJ domain-containing protein [Desulfobacterota bacterium]|nr:DnaJ domain-containing protein [Thermodesulfobacteriota bacterium]
MQTRMHLDYYMILGVDATASAREIKQAYRALAMKYHPDMNQGDPLSEEKFKLISEAYEILKDDEKRRIYDASRLQQTAEESRQRRYTEAPPIMYGDELLQDFYRGFYGGKDSRKDRRAVGRDIRLNIRIGLRDAARGTETTIFVPFLTKCPLCRGTGMKAGARIIRCSECRQQGKIRDPHGFYKQCPICKGRGTIITALCGTCQGSGKTWARKELRIRIPAGIETGTRLKVQGLGMRGEYGGKSGDFFVVVHVEEHPFFRRDGIDLYCAVPVPYPKAHRGAHVRVPTLDGTTTIKIPPHTITGTIIRLTGEGIKMEADGRCGDLVFAVMVEQPKKSRTSSQRASSPKKRTHSILYPASLRFQKKLDRYTTLS